METYTAHSLVIPPAVSVFDDRLIYAPPLEVNSYSHKATNLPVTATMTTSTLLVTRGHFDSYQSRPTLGAFATMPAPYRPADQLVTMAGSKIPVMITKLRRSLPSDALVAALEDIDRRHRIESWIRSQSLPIANMSTRATQRDADHHPRPSSQDM